MREKYLGLLCVLSPDGVILLEALVLDPEPGDEAPTRHVHSLGNYVSIYQIFRKSIMFSYFFCKRQSKVFVFHPVQTMY